VTSEPAAPARPATLREGLAVLGVAIRGEPWVFAGAVLGSAVFGVATVATASIMGRITDDVVIPAFRDGAVPAATLATAGLALVGVGLVKALALVGRRLLAGVMQYRLQATYRRRVTRQYLRLPVSWHQRHPTGALLSNAGSDVEATWGPIAPLPMAVGVLVMLVVAIAAMLRADLVLAAVGLLVFPSILAVNLLFQRRLSPLVSRAQELRAEISGIAHESFDGALVVKALGREEAETARFAARVRDLRDVNVAVGRVRGAFDPVLEALPTLGVLGVLLVGTWRLQSGALPAGTVVQVAYLLTIVAFPVRAIGWVLGELPRSVVGWRRVDDVLAATGHVVHGDARLGGSGPAAVVLDDVAYAYEEPGVDPDRPGSPASPVPPPSPALRAVTLDVAAGSTVAVVGPTGSGKSTLAGLLVRLVDPDHGAVRLDGTDLRSLASGETARAAALVFQQSFVFDDTVRDNVTLGAAASDEQVWAALRLAAADRFVAALPHGLATRVGERGTTLSGGQRQRLALARALVRRPRLLVLDDATSAVDPRVEQQVLRGLRERSATGLDVTVVVVAYRRATVALADEVVLIEDGEVTARGRHDELMATSATYRDLLTAYEEDHAPAAADGGPQRAGARQ
jgi:ABC-type multidrug transport system fused ATPase/permease subunit